MDEREAWGSANPCVSSWLERVSPKTAKGFLSYLFDFYHWVQVDGGRYAGKSPEELLDLQDRAIGRERYAQLRLIQKWVGAKTLSLTSKKTMYAAVRSFYLHNLVELPKDVSFRIRGDYETTQSEMSVADFRKVVLASNRLYRTVFLCMYSGGMGERELLLMNRMDDVKQQLERGERLIRVHLPSRKHNAKPYYTLLGSDALTALREYLAKERGATIESQAIFVNDQGNLLTPENIRQNFLSGAFRSGVVKRKASTCPLCGGELKRIRREHIYLRCLQCGNRRILSKEFWLPKETRYRVHPHEIRDLFRSEWQKSGADPFVAEFMMGHTVDPNNYNKFFLDLDYVREQYLIAEPYLDVLSKEPRTVPKAELVDLEEKVKQLQTDKTDLNNRLRDATAGIRQENEEQMREMRKEIDDLTLIILSLQKTLGLAVGQSEPEKAGA